MKKHKFEVGDRVIILKNIDGRHVKDKRGTVVKDHNMKFGDGNSYRIKIDNEEDDWNIGEKAMISEDSTNLNLNQKYYIKMIKKQYGKN